MTVANWPFAQTTHVAGSKSESYAGRPCTVATERNNVKIIKNKDLKARKNTRTLYTQTNVTYASLYYVIKVIKIIEES